MSRVLSRFAEFINPDETNVSNLYDYVAKETGLLRNEVKIILIGKAYGMTEEKMIKDGLSDDAIEIMLERFPNLRHGLPND